MKLSQLIRQLFWKRKKLKCRCQKNNRRKLLRWTVTKTLMLTCRTSRKAATGRMMFMICETNQATNTRNISLCQRGKHFWRDCRKWRIGCMKMGKMRLKVGDPIEERYKESLERGSVIDQLSYCINSYREAAVSNDPKFDHIELAEKQKVLNECVEAELRSMAAGEEAAAGHASQVCHAGSLVS